ncbi:DNA-processing protein DprA [Pseudomonas aeruginosa]
MSPITPVTEKILALSLLKGVGPVALRKISSHPDFKYASVDLLSRHFSVLDKALSTSSAWEIASDLAKLQVEEAINHDARIISSVDEDYPSLLKATKDDPFILFIKGKLLPTSKNSVAIIGTRQPTKHGGMIATRIARFFAENGWSIVSGLAVGCDAIAHTAALKANGHTVAILGHGLQTIYPAAHRKLSDDILNAGGALISEYAFGVKTQPQQLVKRDRIQAGMAQGVIMVQSDIKGGSLHAARAALDYKRWLAVPYPTLEDIENLESKIQANLLLAGNDQKQKLDLLRCDIEALSGLVIIRGKEGYQGLLNKCINEDALSLF